MENGILTARWLTQEHQWTTGESDRIGKGEQSTKWVVRLRKLMPLINDGLKNESMLNRESRIIIHADCSLDYKKTFGMYWMIQHDWASVKCTRWKGERNWPGRKRESKQLERGNHARERVRVIPLLPMHRPSSWYILSFSLALSRDNVKGRETRSCRKKERETRCSLYNHHVKGLLALLLVHSKKFISTGLVFLITAKCSYWH